MKEKLVKKLIENGFDDIQTWGYVSVPVRDSNDISEAMLIAATMGMQLWIVASDARNGRDHLLFVPKWERPPKGTRLLPGFFKSIQKGNTMWVPAIHTDNGIAHMIFRGIQGYSGIKKIFAHLYGSSAEISALPWQEEGEPPEEPEIVYIVYIDRNDLFSDGSTTAAPLAWWTAKFWHEGYRYDELQANMQKLEPIVSKQPYEIKFPPQIWGDEFFKTPWDSGPVWEILDRMYKNEEEGVIDPDTSLDPEALAMVLELRGQLSPFDL